MTAKVYENFKAEIAFIIFAISLFNCCCGDEILGCGGFIKSPIDIDFTRISVKLYTKSGSLKDQTECAPNTGYYFLRLYDKGQYVLKLDSPVGWSFEPTEVVLNVDESRTDLCSQGKDIFFNFKGFGITGNVVSVSTLPGKKWSVGPKGVTISLFDKSNKTLLAKTLSDNRGSFSFTPIHPGQYVLVASHPIWLMENHSVSVTIKSGNTQIQDGDLSIFGFDVSGRVTTTNGDPVAKATLTLIGDGRVKNCHPNPSISKSVTKNHPPLCSVTSDDSGRFYLPALTSGTYTIFPHYVESKTKFDFQPSEISFTVGLDSLILPQTFKVTGFTISGKVMSSLEPSIPLSGAKVFLSKRQIGVTDSNGIYRSDNVKSKQYTLHVEADNVLFDEMPVKISLNNPELPTIVPSAFKITGKVSSTTQVSLANRKVSLRSLVDHEVQEIAIDPTSGEWSIFVAPGKYQLSVMVSADEKTKGLQFFPTQRNIEVTHIPMKNIDFLQLKATLKGIVTCLEDNQSMSNCKRTRVTLKTTDSAGDSTTVAAKDGEYQFEDVLPGQYQVVVDTTNFCWETSSHQVTVASENPPKLPPFKQTGFSVTFVSSHDTFANFTLRDGKSSKQSSFKVTKGTSKHCIPEFGKYEFHPHGYHKFPKQIYHWSTIDESPIVLSSNEHLHRGHVLSNIAVDGVKIRIEGESGGQRPLVLGPLEYNAENGGYKYSFEFYAISGESYLIHPLSDTLLFEPPSLKVVGLEDYTDNAVKFVGVQGKIFTGSISPPLQGVTVKIFGKDKDTPSHTIVTQQNGIFRVGPLDGSASYTITAEKEGYVLNRDTNSKDIVFHAKKLAEVNVEVLGIEGGPAMQGVLISLSGSNGINSYRKNSVTDENGKLTFLSLSPGEYYLRPTMKEYRFDPASRMIRVEEGATVTVKLIGHRVAFSAYGVVTSLNGQPEPNVLVEARGQGDCSDLQEEAQTKEDGTWRIRGLEPRCLYAIRLKLNQQEAITGAKRAIPSSIAVVASQDVYNLKLISVQPISRFDLSVRLTANQMDYYKTLKVKLCRENSPDSPIHVMRIDGQILQRITNSGVLLHFPSLQADGKKYFVLLETSLPRHLHSYKIEPAYFQTNSSFKYLEVAFDAERRLDQADTIQMSFIPLPLIILVTVAFLNRDSLSIWLNTKMENWSKRSQITAKNSQANLAVIVPNDPRADDIIVEQIESINRKSKKVRPRKA